MDSMRVAVANASAARRRRAMNADAPRAGASPGRFLFAAFAASWGLWVAAIMGQSVLARPLLTTLRLGGFAAVGLVALALALRTGGARRWLRAGLRDGFAPAVGLGIAFAFLGVGAAAAAMVASGHALAPGPVWTLAADLPAFVKTFAFSVVLGPLLEELAWRGTALEPLQRRWGALAGAGILALVHAAWHLPLSLLAGTDFHEMGLFTSGFWRFVADVLAFDLMAAAVYRRAGASIPAAALFHGAFNLAGGLLQLDAPAGALKVGVDVALTATIVIATRGRLFAPAAYPLKSGGGI